MAYVPEPTIKFATSYSRKTMRNRQKSRDQIIFNSVNFESLALSKQIDTDVSNSHPDDFLATSMQVQQIKDLLVEPGAVSRHKRIQHKTSQGLRNSSNATMQQSRKSTRNDTWAVKSGVYSRHLDYSAAQGKATLSPISKKTDTNNTFKINGGDRSSIATVRHRMRLSYAEQ